MTALLRSGKNVVTPVAWIYPGTKQRAVLEEACAAGGSTLHGTGVNPGGVPDLRTYNSPDVVRHIMCFGGTPEEATSGPMLSLLSAGFERSVQMCLDVLGFSADAEIRADLELAVATASIDSPIGVIEPGQVAGQRFVWDAVVRDQVVVRVAVNWLMGEEHLDPAWNFGPEGERFEVEVRGDPDTFVTIQGWQPDTVAEGLLRNPGIVVTAMHCMNSIPVVCAAAPRGQDLRRPAVGRRPGPSRPGVGRLSTRTDV